MAGAVAAAADFASPLGDFSDYLSWGTGALCLVLLVYWKTARRKVPQAEVETSLIPKAIVYCATSAIIFGVISISKASADTPKEGLLASYIPGLIGLQKAIFRLEEVTKEMNVKIGKIETEVSQLKKIYTIEQIQKLEEQEIWQDVVTHLEDIEPLARDEEWQRLLENSVFQHLKDLERRQELDLAAEVADKTFEKYKTLKRSERAMKLRNKIGLRNLEVCLQASQPLRDCHPLSIRFIEYDEKYRTELGLATGILTTYHRFHRGGLPYFAIALEEAASPAVCANERFALAVQNALSGPESDELTQLSRQLAGKCFTQLKSVLAGELAAAEKRSPLAVSLCRMFKQHQAKHPKCK